MPHASVATALLFLTLSAVIVYLVVELRRARARSAALQSQSPAQSLPRPPGASRGGLPLGAQVPDFDLPLIGGGRLRLSACRGREILLLFFNPRCEHSLRLVLPLRSLSADRLDKDPFPIVVSTGDPEENRRLFAKHPIASCVVLQHASETATLFRAIGTPMGYLIDPTGKTTTPLIVGPSALGLTLSIQRAQV